MRTLVGTGLAAAGTAVLGGLASSAADSPWFRRLRTPPWQPPPVAFPVVWTALYADVAVASAVTIDRLRADNRPGDAAAYERALAANLLLNASWTWTFFRFHRLAPAIAVAGALAVSSGDLARRAAPVSTPAAAGIGTYAAWCAFATALSTAIWRRNR